MLNKVKESNSRLFLILVVLLAYVSSEVFSWLLLETDSFTQGLFASSLSDGIAWTDSARNKFLYGYWYHEILDDWRPIFIIPIHQILTWIGYESFGLTLSGFRLFPFLFIHLSKILILYVILREFKVRYFLLATLFLAIYPPLNELGRIGTMDSAQAGLYFIAGFLYYFSDSAKSNIWKVLTGMFIAIAVLYKISGLVFLLLPFIFIVVSNGFNTLWKDIRNIKSELYFYYMGVSIIVIPYLLFWQIPNLDETVYFSIRMFGVHAGMVSISDYMLIFQRIIDFLSTESFMKYVVDYHAWWLIGYLLFLIAASLIPRGKLNRLDYLLISVFFIFLIQIIFFDMAFRRYLGLIPFGVVALIRSFNILVNVGDYQVGKSKSYLGSVIFSYSLYLLVSFVLKAFFDVTVMPLYFSIVIASLVFVYFKFINRYVWKYGYYLLFSLILIYIPPNYFYINQYFSKIDYGMKTASIEMGEKMGEARVIEAHEYSLYNRTRNSYLGSHSGQFKPDGWVYDENKKQTLMEFAEQESSNNFWALKLKLFNDLYPGFLNRWYLPDNYESLYKSNLFANYDKFYTNNHNYDLYLYTHYAKRHLVIGMNDPVVYILDRVKFNDASGKEVKLKYDKRKTVKIKLPDSVANRYWYGLHEKVRSSYMTFNLRVQ